MRAGWSPTIRGCGPSTKRITDPAHRQAADQLRRDRLTVIPPPGEVDVERRRLSDYDLRPRRH